MVRKILEHRTPLPASLPQIVLRTALRVSQILVSLVIAGLYGRDLQRATRKDEKADSRWVFAEVVAGLSAIVAGAYLIPAVKSHKTFFVDGLLFILWMVLFGTFGKPYVGENCQGNGDCNRMKTAVWFDLVGMLLWFTSFGVGTFMFWRDRHGKSLYTGRSSVV